MIGRFFDIAWFLIRGHKAVDHEEIAREMAVRETRRWLEREEV